MSPVFTLPFAWTKTGFATRTTELLLELRSAGVLALRFHLEARARVAAHVPNPAFPDFLIECPREPPLWAGWLELEDALRTRVARPVLDLASKAMFRDGFLSDAIYPLTRQTDGDADLDLLLAPGVALLSLADFAEEVIEEEAAHRDITQFTLSRAFYMIGEDTRDTAHGTLRAQHRIQDAYAHLTPWVTFFDQDGVEQVPALPAIEGAPALS